MKPAAKVILLRALGKPDPETTRGLPFFRFADLPPQWRFLVTARCLFCKRGRRELDGLWQYNKTHRVCKDCREQLRRGKMPAVKALSAVWGAR